MIAVVGILVFLVGWLLHTNHTLNYMLQTALEDGGHCAGCACEDAEETHVRVYAEPLTEKEIKTLIQTAVVNRDGAIPRS